MRTRDERRESPPSILVLAVDPEAAREIARGGEEGAPPIRFAAWERAEDLVRGGGILSGLACEAGEDLSRRRTLVENARRARADLPVVSFSLSGAAPAGTGQA